MNRTLRIIWVLAFVLIGSLSAGTLKGMSLNGSTGLVSIPSGRIGWEKSTDFGFDVGYHTIMADENIHIPKVSISLFKMAELGFAYDTQDDPDNADMIMHGKLQLPIKGTSAVSFGGNVQFLKQKGMEDQTISQLYLACTYPGEFFNMPAETTAVIGKRFGENAPDDAIDFGMGFDLNLFPDTFQGYIHWINDFSNFSYQQQAVYGANANSRGVFNTGIRIDFASIPKFSKYKFAVDAIITDALDSNRAFCLGIAFGAPLGN
ncbi:MAG: hypothetical protein B6241_05320 [Spirochaetaceae bacterium 4572_59]|nr:MAG: hypothetical protein B6241_05320 [Spirochaetaceae bacterium 4572_59]